MLSSTTAPSITSWWRLSPSLLSLYAPSYQFHWKFASPPLPSATFPCFFCRLTPPHVVFLCSLSSCCPHMASAYLPASTNRFPLALSPTLSPPSPSLFTSGLHMPLAWPPCLPSATICLFSLLLLFLHRSPPCCSTYICSLLFLQLSPTLPLHLFASSTSFIHSPFHMTCLVHLLLFRRHGDKWMCAGHTDNTRIDLPAPPTAPYATHSAVCLPTCPPLSTSLPRSYSHSLPSHFSTLSLSPRLSQL